MRSSGLVLAAAAIGWSTLAHADDKAAEAVRMARPLLSADGTHLVLPRNSDDFNMARRSRSLTADLVAVGATKGAAFDVHELEVPKGCVQKLDAVPLGKTVEIFMNDDEDDCTFVDDTHKAAKGAGTWAQLAARLAHDGFAPLAWSNGPDAVGDQTTIGLGGPMLLDVAAKRREDAVVVSLEARRGLHVVGAAEQTFTPPADGFAVGKVRLTGAAIVPRPGATSYLYVKLTITDDETDQGGVVGDSYDVWLAIKLANPS